MTLDVFTDECEKKCWSPERIEQEWKLALLNPMNKVLKENGETLLLKYMGVYFDEDEGSGKGVSVKET
jgi:hypothetical protein